MVNRFEFREIHDGGIVPRIYDTVTGEYANLLECINWLNNLNVENQLLKKKNEDLKSELTVIKFMR
jgi:cell shape-determining protein MreC